MLKETLRMSSYPLPAKGGTPPILRGEKGLILPLKRLNRYKPSRFHLV